MGRPSPLPRAALDGIPTYVPKPPQPPASGVSYRLFLNENPYPPLPSAITAIARAAEQANLYPDIMPGRLVDALARKLEVPPEHVVTGPGSVGIYQQIGQAMIPPGTEVIYAWPSFEAFPIVTRVAGAIPVEVPLRRHAHDLDAMAAAITPRTSAILLCEPNNPTGSMVGDSAITRFLGRVPDDVLVVMDEAYFEFCRSPDAVDGVALHRDRPNLVVLRTFSKAYGLAALRVGYAVAQPDVADAMRKCAVPCGVSRVAEEAALAALGAENELFERVDRIVAERERLRAALGALGWDVPPSQANFLWLPLGGESSIIAAGLQQAGLLVRDFPGAGLRITVGGPAANDLLVRSAGLPTSVL
jgi:histidinol-phosphate aminotransferase